MQEKGFIFITGFTHFAKNVELVHSRRVKKAMRMEAAWLQ
jgi:hypothetical protein